MANKNASLTPEALKPYRVLFQHSEQGFCLIEQLSASDSSLSDYRYILANPAFERHTGMSGVEGQTIRKLVPGIEEEVLARYDRVVASGQPEHFETYLQTPGRWIGGEAFASGLTRTVAVLFNDITENKQIELALRESEQQMALFIEALPVGVGFYNDQGEFQVMNRQMVYYLPNGLMPSREPERAWRWKAWDAEDKPIDPQSYPGARALRGEAVFPGLEMQYTDDAGEEVWASVVAVPMRDTQGQQIAQACIITDITALKRTGRALALSEKRFRSFVEASSELVYRMSPDWFEMYMLDGKDMLNDTLQPSTNWVDVYIPQEDRQQVWSVVRQAIAGKQVFELEHRVIRADGSIGWAASRAVPILNEQGEIEEWIGAAADITAIREAELQYRDQLEKEVRERTAELQESRDFAQSITEIIPDVVTIVELPSRNILFTNKDTLIWLNFDPEEIARMTFNERINLFHPEDLPRIQAFYEEFGTLADGDLKLMEYRLRNKKGEWVLVLLRGKVFKRDAAGKVTQALFMGQDITELRKAQRKLQESRDQLQSIFDTTLVQMSILKAVRDEQNQIIDFEIELVNKELEKETGRNDLTGKWYAREYPGIKQAGLFDLIVKAVETGQPQATEYFYPHDGFHKWFTCTFVKFDDGVVATNMDITASKQAEEERFKNYLLLQQSEELALLGSWDYNRLTGAFTWSDGMYRLFDLERGREIQPEIYLEYATPDCRPTAAERIIRHLRSGDTDFEETLEISVGGRVKVLHLKASVVKNEEGHPVRVLGVDMDISALRAAEEKIRKMEVEQQLEVFRVSLSTLEEERHRISESLHNGIGQILYGIKLSLGSIKQGRDAEAFNEAKKYTGKLLSDAIVETRRISHELMPTTLQEFGLKSAVEDICGQLSNGVQFTCKVEGLTDRLEKYLELAVYRTVQELMTNVVKHAKATTGQVDIQLLARLIRIEVSDNGQGMEAGTRQKPGIGLASIRSKVELLKGTVEIKSSPAGTGVSIIIPRPGN